MQGHLIHIYYMLKRLKCYMWCWKHSKFFVWTLKSILLMCSGIMWRTLWLGVNLKKVFILFFCWGVRGCAAAKRGATGNHLLLNLIMPYPQRVCAIHLKGPVAPVINMFSSSCNKCKKFSYLAMMRFQLKVVESCRSMEKASRLVNGDYN